jgi:ABC-2 type transport system permease protein/lipopolysaccharide transport system permease protein
MGDLLDRARRDIYGGLANWRLWTALGWYEVRQRYRRSVFGPLWSTMSLAIAVAAIGTIYAKLFNRPPEVYVPHLTLGFLIWILLSNIIKRSCRVFVRAERYIKGTRAPLSSFVFLILWFDVIIFLYQSFVYVIVAVIFNIIPGPVILLSGLGFALLILNGVWFALFMGILATRYRDITEIISNIMQISFFVTPILWMPDMLGRSLGVLDFNPFYHFVELLRAPLLGQAPEALSWWVVLGITAVGWIAAFLLFARYRGRIAYWL